MIVKQIVTPEEAFRLTLAGEEVYSFTPVGHDMYRREWVGEVKLKDIQNSLLVIMDDEQTKAAESTGQDPEEQNPDVSDLLPTEMSEAKSEPEQPMKTLSDGTKSRLSTFEMYQLRQQGLTLDEIAEKAGVSSTTVFKRLKGYDSQSAEEAVRSLRRMKKEKE